MTSLAENRSRSLVISNLVDSEGDYLFAYALRHTRDRSAAEELVQETYLAAVQGAQSFQGMSSARTWLTSILRHKIIDRLRRISKENAVAIGPEGENDLDCYFEENGHWTESSMPCAWSANPGKLVEQKEFLKTVEECLAKLPAKLRQIFLLREMDGLATEDICNSLELSATNVRVILHRSRTHLRSCLEQNWFLRTEAAS